MPRPRYPSDDERARPAVRIHTTIRHHPTYGPVLADFETRGIIWSLWLVAMASYAARTSNRVTIAAEDALWITGRRRPTDAIRALYRACRRMGYPVWYTAKPTREELRGGAPPTQKPLRSGEEVSQFSITSVTVEIRNFAVKQGLTPRLRPSESKAESTDVPSTTPEHPTSSELGTSAGVPPAPEAQGSSTRPAPTRPNGVRPTGEDRPSVTDVLAAIKRAESVELEDVIFIRGKKVLAARDGIKDEEAGSYLGMLRKAFGAPAVAGAVAYMETSAVPSNCREWLKKYLAGGFNGGPERRDVKLLDQGGKVVRVPPKAKVVWQKPQDRGINGYATPDGKYFYVTSGLAEWV